MNTLSGFFDIKEKRMGCSYERDFRLCTVMDIRQEKKVLHKIADIILLVFFATLANADDWVEIEMFGKEHEDFLQNYLELA